MTHRITIHRQKDERLDGWILKFNGQTYHDCTLGSLVRYLKALNILKTGDEYQIVNHFEGTYKTQVA